MYLNAECEFPPPQLPDADRHDRMYCSERSTSRSGVSHAMLMIHSRQLTAPKAQQLPQGPWFRAGVVQSRSLWIIQLNSDGQFENVFGLGDSSFSGDNGR